MAVPWAMLAILVGIIAGPGKPMIATGIIACAALTLRAVGQQRHIALVLRAYFVVKVTLHLLTWATAGEDDHRIE